MLGWLDTKKEGRWSHCGDHVRNLFLCRIFWCPVARPRSLTADGCQLNDYRTVDYLLDNSGSFS